MDNRKLFDTTWWLGYSSSLWWGIAWASVSVYPCLEICGIEICHRLLLTRKRKQREEPWKFQQVTECTAFRSLRVKKNAKRWVSSMGKSTHDSMRYIPIYLIIKQDRQVVPQKHRELQQFEQSGACCPWQPGYLQFHRSCTPQYQVDHFGGRIHGRERRHCGTYSNLIFSQEPPLEPPLIEWVPAGSAPLRNGSWPDRHR